MKNIKHLLLIGWAAAFVFIVVMSLIPTEVVTANNDKQLHFLAYAALAFPACIFFREQNARTIILMIFLCSALIEIMQSFTGYREGSLADLMFNGIGILIGVTCSYIFKKLNLFKDIMKL